MKIEGRWHALGAMVLAVAVAACGSESQANEAAQEESGDAAAEAPAAQETAGTSRTEDRPERRAPSRATVASGTKISLTLDQKLSTENNKKGDAFSATVSEPVTDGSRVLVPEGATVRGEVTALQKASGDKPAVLKVDFSSIEVRGERRPLSATLTAADVETDKEMKGEAKKIGGGAAAGGLVGGILGKDAKSTLIGAAVGSAAGTAITLATRQEHAVLPAGTPMEIRLDESVRVKL